MKLTKGATRVNGSIAFVSQQSWIFSGTVRDNILMGSVLEAEWYNYVVEVSALTRDFQILDKGDLTEVGEKGMLLEINMDVISLSRKKAEAWGEAR